MEVSRPPWITLTQLSSKELQTAFQEPPSPSAKGPRRGPSRCKWLWQWHVTHCCCWGEIDATCRPVVFLLFDRSQPPSVLLFLEIGTIRCSCNYWKRKSLISFLGGGGAQFGFRNRGPRALVVVVLCITQNRQKTSKPKIQAGVMNIIYCLYLCTLKDVNHTVIGKCKNKQNLIKILVLYVPHIKEFSLNFTLCFDIATWREAEMPKMKRKQSISNDILYSTKLVPHSPGQNVFTQQSKNQLCCQNLSFSLFTAFIPCGGKKQTIY